MQATCFRSESRFSEVPLLGAIPAGLAYEERSDGGVAIDRHRLAYRLGRTFAFVRGDSMTGRYIGGMSLSWNIGSRVMGCGRDSHRQGNDAKTIRS